ncbi:hypothetical protein IFR05_008428, partial [Cadophora sp. M221]
NDAESWYCKASGLMQRVGATSRRAKVVERALGGLDVNVVSRRSNRKNKKIEKKSRGRSPVLKFSNLSLRPKVKDTGE